MAIQKSYSIIEQKSIIWTRLGACLEYYGPRPKSIHCYYHYLIMPMFTEKIISLLT